jgi:hypothetical protein
MRVGSKGQEWNGLFTGFFLFGWFGVICSFDLRTNWELRILQKRKDTTKFNTDFSKQDDGKDNFLWMCCYFSM